MFMCVCAMMMMMSNHIHRARRFQFDHFAISSHLSDTLRLHQIGRSVAHSHSTFTTRTHTHTHTTRRETPPLRCSLQLPPVHRAMNDLDRVSRATSDDVDLRRVSVQTSECMRMRLPTATATCTCVKCQCVLLFGIRSWARSWSIHAPIVYLKAHG